MVDVPRGGDGDGLKASVRVLRKAWHLPSVVHAPAVLQGEITAHVATLQVSGFNPLFVIPWGIVVAMMGAEQKWVDCRPMQTERYGVDDGGRHV